MSINQHLTNHSHNNSMRHNQPPQQTMSEDQLSLIRDMTIDEIGAIEMYKTHLLQSDNDKLNKIITEILADEQKHFNTLLDILRKYDKKQGELFIEVNSDLPRVEDHGNLYASSNYNVEQTLLNEIKGELQAVNDYEKIARQIPIMEVRNKILMIINDEKQHIEELTKMLKDIEK